MASANVLALTTENFQSTIASGVTLVDFWAEWCGPCRMQGPIVDSLAEKMAGKVKVAKLNVDVSPEIAAQFGIMSIPTIMIFKDGEAVNQMVGLQNEASLTKALNA